MRRGYFHPICAGNSMTLLKGMQIIWLTWHLCLQICLDMFNLYDFIVHPEDGGSLVPQNVGILPYYYTISTHIFAATQQCTQPQRVDTGHIAVDWWVPHISLVLVHTGSTTAGC